MNPGKFTYTHRLLLIKAAGIRILVKPSGFIFKFDLIKEFVEVCLIKVVIFFNLTYISHLSILERNYRNLKKFKVEEFKILRLELLMSYCINKFSFLSAVWVLDEVNSSGFSLYSLIADKRTCADPNVWCTGLAH